ncbi:MAG: sigma-70 family RNA polymerase sigma factor [Thermoanaerobaculia bacterium]|nr:sigma-70 family RNA polymerase sigma factor [Thermoanaerobaculia bacterium]
MSERDSDLVQATLNGDSGAFAQLVGRYDRKIYNLALRVTGDPQDAMDATQSAFLKAYDHLDDFDPSRRFFSWIYRIGLNEALGLVRHRTRYVPLEADPPQRRADPEQETAGRETGREIRWALGQLSAEQRAVMVLRHLHGLTYQEMSQVVGVPVGRVKSRLFAARTRLRQLLHEKGLCP